ncbi:MAG: hypothetical protein A2663_03860 [Candidatus Buchananbacteria bacterium RIFCSPHIGHO2_01_FULL_46_12]|uniref:Uncharacterized protein n=1 Tax=Candidatus Buchananbacteria bacterium RIFCSPHIGHO2_01_FULL_46_12 TaxID=1797536 RepID=A0A1G1Y1R9_9BACT|nr:MAG: hypothetical protein A2663_03860 [Candidatus Buchananbacteria bacterium RIFCSPHIGHO2_01_FULL_46_12]
MAVANPDSLTLEEWHRRNFPDAGLGQLTALQINGLDGLRAPDNLTYYLISPQDKSQIYILTYNIGNFLTTNFLTTFNLVVKSFKLQ